MDRKSETARNRSEQWIINLNHEAALAGRQAVAQMLPSAAATLLSPDSLMGQSCQRDLGRQLRECRGYRVGLSFTPLAPRR
jgi:hypothetical protein